MHEKAYWKHQGASALLHACLLRFENGALHLDSCQSMSRQDRQVVNVVCQTCQAVPAV